MCAECVYLELPLEDVPRDVLERSELAEPGVVDETLDVSPVAEHLIDGGGY